MQFVGKEEEVFEIKLGLISLNLYVGTVIGDKVKTFPVISKTRILNFLVQQNSPENLFVQIHGALILPFPFLPD